jgi:hypothetical protein
MLVCLVVAALSGCGGSPCSGEFVSQNDSCSPGCGVPIAYHPPCGAGGTGLVTWCVRESTAGHTEDIRCIIDEETGRMYDQAIYPESVDVPANVRYCTTEEEQSAYCPSP